MEHRVRNEAVHWMQEGFASVLSLLPDSKSFAFDDRPSIADVCIVAQVYNALQWGVELSDYPKITRIEQQCLALSAFNDAHPDNQPDAKEIT